MLQQDDGEPLPEGFKVAHKPKPTDGKHMLPPSDAEIDRLDQQHFIMRHLVHGNFNAPMEESLQRGIRVLDLGCGSGLWTLEMAWDYPNSFFIGVDVVEMYPRGGDLPPNVTFQTVDKLHDLPFADGEFDYVFERFMVFEFTPDDWHVTIKELTRVTKSGGWVELFEHDLAALKRVPKNMHVWNAITQMLSTHGIDLSYVQRLPSLLLAEGFEDIEEDYISVPYGWGGRVGELSSQNIYAAWMGFAPVILPQLGIDMEEYARQVRVLVFDLFKQSRAWNKAPYVYGRKA